MISHFHNFFPKIFQLVRPGGKTGRCPCLRVPILIVPYGRPEPVEPFVDQLPVQGHMVQTMSLQHFIRLDI